jgi:hypothetical protein
MATPVVHGTRALEDRVRVRDRARVGEPELRDEPILQRAPRDSSPRAAGWRVPRTLAVVSSFLVSSAASQAPGLSNDWLLSEAGASRNYPPWADEHHHGRRLGSLRDQDYIRYYAPYAAFIQRELCAGSLPLWNLYIATGAPVVESMQPALFFPVTLLLFVVAFEHA